MSKRADGSYSPAWRRASKIILWPVIQVGMKHDWHGQQNIRNIPADQGIILAINHLSYADIFADSLFAYEAGRYPVFLAKSSLFDIKVLGSIIRKLGQLPVYRGQADAALVLKDAEQGIKNGACVIFYPEATVTRDPGQWPMAAKTGAARLALATGAPVIPVAHWGAQHILPYGSFRPHLVPRTTVQVTAGPPVDLSEFEGQPPTPAVLRAATEKIMKDITALLAGIRGETPPDEPYHPAVARRKARQEAREREGQATTGTPAGSGPAGAGPVDASAVDASAVDSSTVDSSTVDSSTVDSSTEATPT
jgi:1-acyl-sn-glycerol-3-phosphate acyltransferase